MDTYPWHCCRTCLSAQSLYPIFTTPDNVEKYSTVLFTITGLKVQPNDTLPQEMCTDCINFINESVKFRKKCEESHKLLLNRSNGEHIKVESHIVKEEKTTAIDISALDDDFKDYDDNVTLDSLTSQYYQDRCNDNNLEVKEQSLEIIINDKNKNNDPVDIVLANKNTESNEKPKRKTRAKKEKEDKKVKEKGEKGREQIECEYCHKVLTSKLSLRNHYKIHTGFDVVCEHCGKKFITRRLLLMHCRAKHGYEKTDKCSYCDYKASNAEQVKIHERLHTGEKPYVCGECKAGFHRKSSYLQHIAIHLPEKNVQCDICPARFKSVTLMRIHKNRHRAPQWSFRCRVCLGAFARRRNVARHLTRVHGLPPDMQHIDRLKIT